MLEMIDQILDEVKSEGREALARDIDYVISELRSIQDELS